MGKNTVRFQCQHCSHCCRDVVCLPTPWDVIRIVKATGKNPRDFLEFITPDDITGVYGTDPAWLVCQKKKYMMALRRDAVRGCYFLDRKKHRCAIYDARPLLCRLYPFQVHETQDGEFSSFTLHKTGIECPKNRDGEVPTAPLYALYKEDSGHHDAYHDLVDHFNRTDFPGRTPDAFIDLFIVKE